MSVVFTFVMSHFFSLMCLQFFEAILNQSYEMWRSMKPHFNHINTSAFKTHCIVLMLYSVLHLHSSCRFSNNRQHSLDVNLVFVHAPFLNRLTDPDPLSFFSQLFAVRKKLCIHLSAMFWKKKVWHTNVLEKMCVDEYRGLYWLLSLSPELQCTYI